MWYLLIFYCVFSFIFMLGVAVYKYDDGWEHYPWYIYISVTLLAPIFFPFILGFNLCDK